MIAASRSFVAAADEVYRLQTGDDDESRFLQSFADHGHYRGQGGTRQGIYVCTPSGKLLASVNSLNPDVVLKTIENGLVKWKSTPLDQRFARTASSAPTGRRENQVPRDGLVLRSTIRDLTEDGKPKERWNRDYVWFSASEMQGWLPEELRRETDSNFNPMLRLTRFHLVDNARGQTIPYHSNDIVMDMEPVHIVHRKGSRVQFEIKGHTQASSDGVWTPTRKSPRAMKVDLTGWAEYDEAAAKFTHFELIATGEWHGATQFNGRRHEGPRGSVAWVFDLVSDPDQECIPPTFIELYDADWLE
ncbi:MAG: hypothetical protein ACPGXK_15245 [Phycisphaerae bacterium]